MTLTNADMKCSDEKSDPVQKFSPEEGFPLCKRGVPPIKRKTKGRCYAT